MLGQFYGESDFDQANKQPSELEGTADCQLPDAKAKLIQALMSQEGLSTGEAVLVEDDPAEIASVQGICQSVFVSERKGMTTAELEELRSMVGARKDSSQVPQAKTVATPKQVPAAATSTREASLMTVWVCHGRSFCKLISYSINIFDIIYLFDNIWVVKPWGSKDIERICFAHILFCPFSLLRFAFMCKRAMALCNWPIKLQGYDECLIGNDGNMKHVHV